jgi:hypothetical protein
VKGFIESFINDGILKNLLTAGFPVPGNREKTNKFRSRRERLPRNLSVFSGFRNSSENPAARISDIEDKNGE